MTRHTTVVFDYSVLCHLLHHSLAATEIPKEHYAGVLKAYLVNILSGDYLGIMKPEKLQTVFCLDSKPYWRSEYLLREEVWTKVDRFGKRGRVLEPQPIYYKAGRKFPEYPFTKLKNKMLDLIREEGFPILEGAGYEADDMAACMVMCNRLLPEEKRHNLILNTVDTDWLGLVDQYTQWFCMRGYYPRLRGNIEEINHWSHKRLGTWFDSPEELWTYKAVHGDKSDNLPEFSPLEVIDITRPPKEYCSWEQSVTRNKAIEYLLYPVDHNAKFFTVTSTKYLMALGLTTGIRKLEPSKDCLPITQQRLLPETIITTIKAA